MAMTSLKIYRTLTVAVAKLNNLAASLRDEKITKDEAIKKARIELDILNEAFKGE